MKKHHVMWAVLGCLLLSACAASVQRPAGPTGDLGIPVSATARIALLVQADPEIAASKDWELFRTEWRTAMAATAAAAGREFVHLDAMPPAGGEEGTLVVVKVNDYRYLSPGARYGFGVMTGNAYIDADAQFLVFPELRLAGTRKYATSSSAWQGIFSAMTGKQLEAITAEMLKEIDSR